MGSEYKIEYTFKPNYSYSIVVNTRSINSSGATPSLRLKITNSTSSSAICSGPQTIDGTSTGTLILTKVIPNGNFANQTYTFNSIPGASNIPYLTLANLPSGNGGSQTIEISKITITESAPPVSFTLPATTTIQCGSTSPVIFTVITASNPNNLTITDYTWNFGPNSGWLYNGNSASSPISTVTSNTITLTPVCGTNQSSITATVTAGGSAYPTNSSSISYTVPSLSLDGSGAICSTSGQYQIIGLPCSASVSWTSSNTSIATVPSSGNPVTVSRVGSATGSVVLTAVVSGLCGSPNQTFTTTIAVGSAPVVPSFSPGYWTSIPNPPSTIYGTGCFTSSNKSMTFTYNGVSNLTAIPYNNSSYPYVVGNTIAWNYPVGLSTGLLRVDYDVACGHVTQVLSISNQCNYYSYSMSPNPASSEVTISANNDATESAERRITEINIYDQQGNLKKHFQFNKVKFAKVNVSSLSNGLYFIEFVDGAYKEKQQLLLNR